MGEGELGGVNQGVGQLEHCGDQLQPPKSERTCWRDGTIPCMGSLSAGGLWRVWRGHGGDLVVVHVQVHGRILLVPRDRHVSCPT
jgi:hypothetical protein